MMPTTGGCWGGGTGAFEHFRFADGQTLSWLQLLGRTYSQIISQSTSQSTSQAGAMLVGGAQNDSLTATGGGSTFSGGQGDDSLTGAGGNNTYLYSLGDGSDTIVDTGGQTDAQGNPAPNVLSFGEGITADDISLSLGSLAIRVGANPNDTIHITNFNPNDVFGQRAIDRFAFADGTLLSYEDLLARGFDLAGTAGNDTITGTNIQDRISGGAGNDTLNGGAGDDVLAGGTGNDVLNGNTGSDTYVFNLDDGIDAINEVLGAGDTNALQFGAGIGPGGITAARTGNHLELRHSNGTDKVIVNNWFSQGGSGYMLDWVEFTDGTQWLAANIGQMLANSPPTGSVTLSGTAAQGQVLTVGNTLADADGLGTIGYQWQASNNGAAWGDIVGATGNSFTLAEAQVGLQVRAMANYTDGRGKAETVASAASAAVVNVNDAPIAATPLVNQAATQGQAFSFTLPANVFSDPDLIHGDTLNYSATWSNGSALPGWLIFNSATKTFSGTPANGDVGALSLKVTATDQAGLSVWQTFGLAVANINDAPTLSAALADQQARSGSAFTYQMPANAFADIDAGDVLAYSAARADGTVLPAWLNFDPVTRAFNGNPGAADVGQFDVRVVATDLGGLAAFDVFTLAVGPGAITGTPGNDNLIGTAGADTLIGGMGNDTYVVDNTGDSVTENANEGTDTVQSAITWTLGANLENLTLTGTATINGAGNVLNNVLTGNSAVNTLTGGAGNDVLDGGAGLDTLIGGTGDDIYVMDAQTETVIELANEGTDTVIFNAPYLDMRLPNNVENLILQEGIAWIGRGNDLNNLILGNSLDDQLAGEAGNDRLEGYAGNDRLSGGTGLDTMIGGLGDDTYMVDNVGDAVMENANEGSDKIQSSITWTLGANVENLTLTGTAALNGTGNSLDNVLTGNFGANTITGDAGNDTLNGAGGTDTLIGGAGNDLYLLNRGNGADTLQENDATLGNTDIARFGSDVAHDQIWFRHVGNNLEASIIGTADKLVLKDWYLGTAYHTERFESGNGKALLDSQVDNLVQSMAAFAPPSAGQTTLPPAYQTTLVPVLAVNWQ